MKIKFAKNIAIIILEHDDLYQLSFKKEKRYSIKLNS